MRTAYPNGSHIDPTPRDAVDTIHRRLESILELAFLYVQRVHLSAIRGCFEFCLHYYKFVHCLIDNHRTSHLAICRMACTAEPTLDTAPDTPDTTPAT